MTEMCAVLLSWAVMLSGYPQPDRCPELVWEQDSYFEGQVIGVYWPGTHEIHVREFLKEWMTRDARSRSWVVHEMVHYLQWLNGKIHDVGDGNVSCDERVVAEREAYAVQQRYLGYYGSGSLGDIGAGGFNCIDVAKTTAEAGSEGK